MRRWFPFLLSLTPMVVFAAAPVRGHLDAQPAQAAARWDVQVGGDPAPGLAAIAFYPSVLTINVGDTVSWAFPSAEPHTVTFDAGQVPGLFFTGAVPNSPGPGDFNFSGVALPSGPGNGPYDGTVAVNSGIPTEPPDERSGFTLTFTRTGVFHYECAVHGPPMSGEITVLPAGADLPETPTEAKGRGQALAANDLANTMIAAEAFPIAAQRTSVAGGSALHVLAAGAPGFHTAVLQFLPTEYTVKRGDYITWTQPDLQEFHTVSFLSGGTAPPLLDVRPQPSGPPLIVIPAAVAAPQGGTTYTGQGVVSSGFMTPGATYTLRIDAPPGTYQFVCLLHGDDFNMKGTITVTE